MKQHGLFIMLLVIFSSGYITYDTGLATSYLHESGFLANPNTNYLKQFTFQGTFERPPQVSFVMYKYSVEYLKPNGYEIEVTEITTTGFKVQLRCLYPNRVWDSPFNWYAYDDRRIQVISVVKYEISYSSASFSTQISHPHFNPNFSKGLVHVTSLCQNGPLDFSISIVSINLQDVVIEIKSNTQNLIQLGYQIFLAIDEAFDVDSQIQFNGDLYTSPTFQFPNDKDWTIGLQGLKWGQTIHIRLKRLPYSTYYTYGKWDASGNGVQTLRFASAQFHRTISKVYLPWIIKTARISQKENYSNQPQPIFQLVISELNKTYSSATTDKIFVSEKSELHVVIQYQCDSQKKKLYTQFFMCNSCDLKKQYYYCLNSANVISIFPLFQSQMNAIGVFTISISNDAITIIQTLQNQLEQTQQLVVIQVQSNSNLPQ